jgi:hypothetical protein
MGLRPILGTLSKMENEKEIGFFSYRDLPSVATAAVHPSGEDVCKLFIISRQ